MTTIEYQRMNTIVPAQRIGNAEILHLYTERQWATTLGEPTLVEEGTYTGLKVFNPDSKSWISYMTDMKHEFESCEEVMKRAHGNVLIAGLGLGMILLPILRKESVNRVLVVERFENVVDLVKPAIRKAVGRKLGGKLDVVVSDIFDWKPDGEKFNTIFFDIWPMVCTDNLEEMAFLHQRGKYWLDRGDPDCWMGSWMQRYLQNYKRNLRVECNRKAPGSWKNPILQDFRRCRSERCAHRNPAGPGKLFRCGDESINDALERAYLSEGEYAI